MRLIISVVLLILGFGSGCATTYGDADRLTGGGQSGSFNHGFANGCDSGYSASGHPWYQFKKDTSEYVSNNQYKIGWDDGYNHCKGSYDANRAGMRPR